MQKAICRFYGEDPCENSAYPRIVNERHFDRLAAMLPEDPAVGGRVDRESLKIEPTLIETTLNDQSPLMTEEIFGPLLPIVPYDNIHEALGYILSRPRPLALYLFSRNRKLQRRVVETIPLWRRLHQRHHLPYHHPLSPLRRNRGQRYGSLSWTLWI